MLVSVANGSYLHVRVHAHPHGKLYALLPLKTRTERAQHPDDLQPRVHR